MKFRYIEAFRDFNIFFHAIIFIYCLRSETDKTLKNVLFVLL